MERETVSDRIFRILLAEEVRKLNLHLPKNKKTLSQLLSEVEPSVDSVDGEKIYFKKTDLERIATMVPPVFHQFLKLPIVLMRRIELGSGVFIVWGGDVEKFFIKKTLELTARGFDEWKAERGEPYLYRIHVQELIGKLGSGVAIGFGIPSDVEWT
ncbi:MAG: DUF61 family protein [Candidatus Bathyarchaeia archaeon]